MSLLGLVVRVVLANRRALLAVIAYAGALAVLYAQPGPLPEAYVPPVVALVPVTAWLVVAGAAAVTTDRSTAHLLAAAAGGPSRLHGLVVASGLLLAAPLALLSLAAGALFASPGPTGRPLAITAGAIAHLVAILVGAGIGAVAARPVVGEPLLAPAVVIGGSILVLVAPWLSPLRPAVNTLAVIDSFGQLATEVGLLALAVVWGGGLAVLGAVIAARRRTYGTAAPS